MSNNNESLSSGLAFLVGIAGFFLGVFGGMEDPEVNAFVAGIVGFIIGGIVGKVVGVAVSIAIQIIIGVVAVAIILWRIVSIVNFLGNL